MRLLALLTLPAGLWLAGCVGMSPELKDFHAAVASADPARVEAYASSHPRTKTYHGRDVRTVDLALYTASRRGDLAMVRGLVAMGADATLPDALAMAAHEGRVEVVRFLLAQGANPQTAPRWSDTDNAVQAARKGGHDELVPILTGTEPNVAAASPRGNLDDEAYNRMRVAANMPPESKAPSSDVDSPKARGASRPDDYALVVGIDNYSKLPAAKFAENDADSVKNHLLALGYPERNIILLKGGQATRGAIQGYVEEWLPKNAKPSSRVFVYFSGHGSPDVKTGDAYLVPWDGDAMFLKSTAYPLKSLYASLSRLKAKRVLVALDSCFSGAGGRSVLAEGARPLVTRVDEAVAPAGVTVLSAASGDEITAILKEQNHGAFTYYLLKALGEGKATAKAAYDSLKPKVQDEARRQNREQTPLLLGDDASF